MGRNIRDTQNRPAQKNDNESKSSYAVGSDPVLLCKTTNKPNCWDPTKNEYSIYLEENDNDDRVDNNKIIGTKSKYIKRHGCSLTGEFNESIRKVTTKRNSLLQRLSVDDGYTPATAQESQPVVFGLGKKKENRYRATLIPTLMTEMNSMEINDNPAIVAEVNNKEISENTDNAKVPNILNTMGLMMIMGTTAAKMNTSNCAIGGRPPFE